MPVVSLPWQYLIVPFGGLSKDLASMTLAPLTDVDCPPLLPPLLPPLEPPPQAATVRAHVAATAPKPTRLLMLSPPTAEPCGGGRTLHDRSKQPSSTHERCQETEGTGRVVRLTATGVAAAETARRRAEWPGLAAGTGAVLDLDAWLWQRPPRFRRTSRSASGLEHGAGGAPR